jgi:arsenate reductase
VSRPIHVLFLCTGNSARSILAEAALNHLPANGGRFRAFSAGSHPKGEVHPLALERLEALGMPTDGLRSKSWDEFAGPDAPPLDFVFTVCGSAAAETCPVWIGTPMTAQWGVDDPAAAQGTDQQKREAFRDAHVALERRIAAFAALPFDTLTGPALLARLRAIGQA